MYPRQELAALARRKQSLRVDCARLRAECATAAARVARPISWLDQLTLLFRRVAPFLRLLPLAALWRAWRSRRDPPA
jgi:hypothetical protein